MIVLIACLSKWEDDNYFREVQTIDEYTSQICSIMVYSIAYNFLKKYPIYLYTKEERLNKFFEEGFLTSFKETLKSHNLKKENIVVVVKYYEEFKYIRDNYECLTVSYRYNDRIKNDFIEHLHEFDMDCGTINSIKTLICSTILPIIS